MYLHQSLLALSLSTLTLATPNNNINKRNYKPSNPTQPPYPTGTGPSIYPTGTATGTSYFPTGTGTGTFPPTSKPTIDAFEVLDYPCQAFENGEILPPFGTLTCCPLGNGDGAGNFKDCIPPFKVNGEEEFDACPISPEAVSTFGNCCAEVNADGTATGCKTATAKYDVTYPPYPPGPPPPQQGSAKKMMMMLKARVKARRARA